MVEYGYVSASFSERDINSFQRVVKETCKQNDFYYSDVVDYIKGDVSADLHLTVFYGLINETIDKPKIKKHIERIGLRSLILGELIFVEGHDNLYKILAVSVLDNNCELETIFNSFRQFDFEKSVQLGFKPHLTLAYLKPNFVLKSTHILPKILRVKQISYFED